MPQYIFLGSFLCSTFLLQWWQQSLYPSWIWIILLEVFIYGIYKKYYLWVSLGAITALVVVSRTTHIPSPNTVDWYAKQTNTTIVGVITDEPDKRPLQTKYTVSVQKMTDASGALHDGVTGNVLITDQRQWPVFEYGDHVTVHGKLQLPEPIDTFRYDQYLSRYNIYSLMYRGSISLTEEENLSLITKHLYRIKTVFESQINTLYPEPHASFMAGLLTGSRKGIPEDRMEDFNKTGLTHIIAISGYNITIVITVIMSALFWLPTKLRYGSSIIAIVLFTLFVGASAAVVRAAIMGILGLLALQEGHKTSALLSVLWTALLMISWNPKILWYDASFQLSFLAVIGLIEISPVLEPYLTRVPRTLAMRESLTMTIAAQIAATPLIILLFGRLSLISPITNLLVAPALPLAMLFGFMGTLISFVSMPLGLIISYGGWATLQWVLWVAKIGARIPLASINIQISTIIILLYYLSLVFTIRRARSPSFPGSTEPLPSSTVSILAE
jgi:competence protein ComEC